MALYRVERPFSSRPVELPQGLLGEVLHDFTHYVVMELSDEGVVSLENAGLSARLISSRQGLSIAGYDFDPASLSERAQIGLADQVVSDDEGQAREQSVFIAQFFSFFPERWSQVISEHGLTAIEYFGDSAYLVLGDLDRTMSLARSSFVRSTVPHTKILRIARDLNEKLVDRVSRGEGSRTDAYLVTFFRAFLEKSSHPLIDAAKDTIETDKHFTRIVAYLSVSEVIELVDDYRVYYIEQHFPLEKEDEVACQVAAGNFDRYFQVHQGYLAWLDSLDVSGAGEAIGICDVGHVDPDHPSFFGRLSLVGVPPDLNGHSTAVAGRAGGIYASPIEPDTGSALIDPDGRLYGVGVAPSVGLVSFKKSDFPQTLSAELCFRHQAPNGEYPRILNLSLGSATKQPMTYEASEKAWDVAIRDPAPFFGQNVGLTCCFSAGNKSDDGLTRPKACKNAIVTGNLVNFRPEAGIEIVSPNIVAQTSSRGNCADGRIKPDVSMPGDYTGSAAYPRPPELGPISFWLSFFRGTSAASPMTAGTCALLSQWIRKRTGSRPSPALLKAILISSCDDTGFGGPAPNTSQGWGRVNLKGILSETSRHVFLDQTSSLSNEVPRFVGSITPANVNEAVRLVLAWTDVPAAAKNSGRTLVNSLVLRARCAGQIFHGNNFVLGASVAGGTPDSIQTAHPGKIVNNVQCVFLTGDLGTIDFEVVVDEMRGNCFAPRDPYSDGDSFSQDFAIFVRNAVISSDDESGALTELV